MYQLIQRVRVVKKKVFLFLPNISQTDPQMTLCGHHCTTNSGNCLFSGSENKICGAAQLSNCLRGQALAIIQVLKQIGLVGLQHCHRVQSTTCLTRSHIHLAIQF